MLNFGLEEIESVYIGDIEVESIYIGNDLVYSIVSDISTNES